VPVLALGEAFTPSALEAALPRVVAAVPLEWLTARRWFGSKAREVRGVRLQDASQLAWDAAAEGGHVLALVVVEYGDEGAETYGMPLAFQAASPGDSSAAQDDAAILEVVFADRPVRVIDALGVPAFGLRLWQLIRDNACLATAHGRIVCQATDELDTAAQPAQGRMLGVEQSNSSIVYDHAWILKCYRKVVAGTSRDLEISRFFTTCTDFRQAPPLAGSIEYVAGDQPPATLAMLQRFVPNRGDGWSTVVERLVGWYRERVGDWVRRSSGLAQ
jgi:maltose alpha-D-glucosyltransferase/alpha-amylase